MQLDFGGIDHRWAKNMILPKMLEGDSESVFASFKKAFALFSKEDNECLPLFLSCQQQLASLSVFSSNEEVEEILSEELPLILLDFYIATTLVHLVPVHAGYLSGFLLKEQS
jgi:hypothetical protein